MSITTARLVLRLITRDEVAGVLSDQRSACWAVDFPSAGDRVIAGLLDRVGLPEAEERRFGHRLVSERSSGQVVGGVGFFGPPQDGVVEIGYGIVESRRGRGYATEAVQAMVAQVFAAHDADAVRAGVDLDNRASIRVLENCGFRWLASNDEQATYEARQTVT